MRIRHHHILTALVIFSLFFVIGCREDEKARGTNDMKYRTYEEFEKSVGGFPYTAPETKKSFLINNYPKLSLGMTKQQVYDILGEPDIESKDFSKYKNPGFLGWCWTYYVYKSDSWGQNPKRDIEVEMFFDKNGKIIWIVPLNIDGLVEKGSPAGNEAK